MIEWACVACGTNEVYAVTREDGRSQWICPRCVAIGTSGAAVTDLFSTVAVRSTWHNAKPPIG